MMIIYLAGPITDVSDYEKEFAEAKASLTKRGHIVLNPAALPQGLGDCDTYMSLCLPMIDLADVVLLKGWQDSRGACREWGYAIAKDKLVVEYEAMGQEAETDG